MSCLNQTGWISNISIHPENEIVAFLALFRPRSRGFDPFQNVVPISLPIYGKYDDDEKCGMREIKKNANVKWIEKNIGPIEDVLITFNNCMSNDSLLTIEDRLRELTIENKFKNSMVADKEKEILKKVSELSGLHINKNSRLCVIIEHKSLFEKWQSETDDMGRFGHCFENAFKDYNIIDEKFEQDYADTTFKSENLKKIRKKGYKNDKIREMYENAFFYIEIYSRHLFLSLYRTKNTNFLLKNKNEVTKLEQLHHYLENTGLCINPPLWHFDNNCYNEQLKHFEDCIKFIKGQIKYFEEQ